MYSRGGYTKSYSSETQYILHVCWDPWGTEKPSSIQIREKKKLKIQQFYPITMHICKQILSVPGLYELDFSGLVIHEQAEIRQAFTQPVASFSTSFVSASRQIRTCLSCT